MRQRGLCMCVYVEYLYLRAFLLYLGKYVFLQMKTGTDCFLCTDYVILRFHNEWDTKFYSKFYKPCSNSYVYIHKILCVLSF